jgi:hypothetical protein
MVVAVYIGARRGSMDPKGDERRNVSAAWRAKLDLTAVVALVALILSATHRISLEIVEPVHSERVHA